MDQAQQLRNVIKQRNQNYIEPALSYYHYKRQGWCRQIQYLCQSGSLAQQTWKESNYF